jgi:GntR family transcriptional regulator
MVAGARVLSARSRPAGPAAAAALRLGEDDPVHEVRRVRLGDGRPIALERSLFPAARFPGMLEFRLDGSLYELLETRYGLRPHRARESLEPVTAGVREAEALDVPEGAPLMQVERTAYARSGEPLEFARDLFRGDRTRVVMWTSELEVAEGTPQDLSCRGGSGRFGDGRENLHLYGRENGRLEPYEVEADDSDVADPSDPS